MKVESMHWSRLHLLMTSSIKDLASQVFFFFFSSHSIAFYMWNNDLYLANRLALSWVQWTKSHSGGCNLGRHSQKSVYLQLDYGHFTLWPGECINQSSLLPLIPASSSRASSPSEKGNRVSNLIKQEPQNSRFLQYSSVSNGIWKKTNLLLPNCSKSSKNKFNLITISGLISLIKYFCDHHLCMLINRAKRNGIKWNIKISLGATCITDTLLPCRAWHR